jgi:hypothetical protein
MRRNGDSTIASEAWSLEAELRLGHEAGAEHDAGQACALHCLRGRAPEWQAFRGGSDAAAQRGAPANPSERRSE